MIIAEIGIDMSRSGLPGAWHGPGCVRDVSGQHITGGKSRSDGPPRQHVATRRARASRLVCGTNPRHLPVAQIWRLSRRIGKKNAAMAVGHSILDAAWHILANDVDYDDLGAD